MRAKHTADGSDERDEDSQVRGWTPRWAVPLCVGLGSVILLVEPGQAASSGQAFCDTSLAETIKNFFGLIQFGGPLLGGVLAMGAAVVTPTVRQADKKMELKEIRNQAIVWGVIVAPLGTSIIQFILNDVVAGGASCGFWPRGSRCVSYWARASPRIPCPSTIPRTGGWRRADLLVR